MTIIDLVNKHDAATPEDMTELIAILSRAIRSNDDGCKEIREILTVEADCLRVSPHGNARARKNIERAERALAAVARLVAERDAAMAARNRMERRNQELVTEIESMRRRPTMKDIELVHVEAGHLRAEAARLRERPLQRDHDDAAVIERAAAAIERLAVHMPRELHAEKLRHAETATALARAQRQIEHLVAENAQHGPALSVQAVQAVQTDPGCTCIPADVLDDLAAAGLVLLPPCPAHPRGPRRDGDGMKKPPW